uniref:Shroom family member 3 n=1 Tax=Jaculus jaculus TaxID=51337 RepID=A0A8C5K9W5_JACJA
IQTRKEGKDSDDRPLPTHSRTNHFIRIGALLQKYLSLSQSKTLPRKTKHQNKTKPSCSASYVPIFDRNVCADPGHADPDVSDSSSLEQLISGPEHRKASWSGGVKLRLKRSEPAGRPHTWHTTKFGENRPHASMMQISQGTMGPSWHQSYHSSSSTSDLSSYDHAYLRRSPDQCSSQGSMESLGPSGRYPPCHLLSPAKSTSSIDQLSHLHNKRDSAYSSFSTSSSVLEYLPPGVSNREQSGSMDITSGRGGILEGMKQADIRYVKTVYDTRRGVSAEYEVNSSALLLQGRDAPTSTNSQGYDKWHSIPRGKGAPSPSWNQQCPSSLEMTTDNLSHVGAPLPPTRSDSYAAFRHRERPSSWSSLDQKRFCRPQTNSSGSLKSPFIEEQLHTVLERSPESSPPVKPKHSYTQKTQPGQPLLPTGIYPVPSPEPHFAQVPQPSVNSNGTLYPALAKESGYAATQGACNKIATLDENGNQNGAGRPGFAICHPLEHDSLSPEEMKPEPTATYIPCKVHFSSVPENEDSSLKRHLTPPQGNTSHPSDRKNTHSNRPCSNHSFQSPQVGDERKLSKPSEPWEGDFQEDHNANLQQKLEKEGLSQSLSSNFGRTKLALSLQNIPESIRRQSNQELGGAQEGYPGRNTKVEDPERKVVAGHRSYPNRPVSYPKPEGKTNTSTSFHSTDSRNEEPAVPAHQQTSSLGGRLNSGSTSALQYRKPHCSVLEKVSKIEQREQGSHRPSSVGSSSYGLNYRPNRTGLTSSTSGSDFEEPKASIHYSEFTEPRNGEPNCQTSDPKLEEVSWQPCGYPLRKDADGRRGPPLGGSEPLRPDTRLLRSQSTFQLFSEVEKEAVWSVDRPRTPESPITVADRRRIFERDSKAGSPLSLSGQELKQFQQSALADYIQRKTGKRPSAAASCGPPEPGLRERAQSTYLQPSIAEPEGIGMASASSLSSLRESSLQPRREGTHLTTTTEAPRAPRDRSSSFAGGRLVGERRRWDPPVPRELLSAANCGPRDIQRVDRTPGRPPSLGTVAKKPGKSKSAEDLLERSDVLAVPVHVRSRSSPTADKKGQDLLPGEDNGFGFVKDPGCLADPGSRSLSYSDRGQEEMPLPVQHPHWGGSGCKATVGSSIPSECLAAPDHLRQASRMPCPRPLSAGMQGYLLDAMVCPLTPLSSPLPSPVPSSNHSQLATDQQTGRDMTHRSDGNTLTQPSSARVQEFNSPDPGVEEGMWKRVLLPQRPSPPWVKWAHAVREDSLSEEASAPEFANPKHYKKQPSLLSSCSTSDPDTPGKVSLRISESTLQASPPPREDYDDEVFVKDLLPKATSSPTFEALPPPSPPPMSHETPVSSSDNFPPPPPQAPYEVPVDREAHREPGSSSSRFSKVTVTRERHVSGAVHLEGNQILASSPPKALVKGSGASESDPPSIMSIQPQFTGSLDKKPSPSWTQNLIHEPVGEIQDVEKKVSAEPQKTSEDIRTEALAKEIVYQDKSLADILDPDSRMKTTMDLMEGLFPRDANVLEEGRTKRKALQKTVSCSGCDGKRSDDKEAVGMLIHCPAYYNVSAAKAELLNKIKDMPEEVNEEEEQVDVNEKKAELIGSLTHKLETLQEAKGSLLMDIKLNNALGEEVEALISELCKPNEFEKYKMFIGDLDKVVNLLLSLSGRLARVENVLSGLSEDASNEERSSLNEKRKILAGQHEDARELKENLDRRERVVLDILANYFSAEQLQDYQHFVKMKSTLLIEQRKLDDKIKLGQEQVKCLLESLPSDFTPKAGVLTLPPALTSHTTPAAGCLVSGICPTLTSPL